MSKVKEDRLLSIKQISEKFDISISTLHKLTMDKKISFYKPNKKIYVEEKEIIKYLKKNYSESQKEVAAKAKIKP